MHKQLCSSGEPSHLLLTAQISGERGFPFLSCFHLSWHWHLNAFLYQQQQQQQLLNNHILYLYIYHRTTVGNNDSKLEIKKITVKINAVTMDKT